MKYPSYADPKSTHAVINSCVFNDKQIAISLALGKRGNQFQKTSVLLKAFGYEIKE